MTRTLLIVEDDDDAREALATILEMEGYSVVDARQGAEALSMLRQGLVPALILLDMRMPGMDGRGFLEEMRGDGRIGSIPVVCFSGEPALQPIRPPVVASLRKPTDLETLLSTLLLTLRERPSVEP